MDVYVTMCLWMYMWLCAYGCICGYVLMDVYVTVCLWMYMWLCAYGCICDYIHESVHMDVYFLLKQRYTLQNLDRST